MTERVSKLFDFLKSDKGYIPFNGVFSTKGISRNQTENIYRHDNISVDVCYDYDYIEVLGLTSSEFNDLEGLIYRENCKERQSCDIEDFSDDEPDEDDEDDIVSINGFVHWLDQITF